MPDTKPEYHPILDPEYDFRTSCTKDDAVRYMMGLLQGPLRFDPYPKGATQEEMDLCDFSLDTMLTGSREWAEVDYRNAVYEKKHQERGVTDDALAKLDAEIAEKLAKLEQCDLAIIKAHKYMCSIDYELAKGGDSTLKIDLSVTGSFQIMIASLSQWAFDTFEIDIFEPRESAIGLIQKDKVAKVSRTIENNLQVKFALLAEIYAETATGLKHGGKPNASAIAKKLVSQAQNSIPPVDGITMNTTEKAISAAIKVKNNQ